MLDIKAWLEELGLGKYTRTFAEHEIDSDVLRDLSDQDLERIGIPLGPRKKILRAIAVLPREERHFRTSASE